MEPSMLRGTVTSCRNRKKRFGTSSLGFSNLVFCCWMTMRDHTRRRQRKNHIATLGWKRLHQRPYSPNLTPCDFYMFPTLEQNLAGRRFGSNAEIKQDVKLFFRMQSLEFFVEGFLNLIKRYDKCAWYLCRKIK
ncbi:histone-lysine N-methyltransferase SETMAR [Trichonephila clavipes]|nr:histone-lysine N-methyltransferase SETMAR [Trichonephila clavipes]